MSLDKLIKEVEILIESRKGGSGSGNFGHSGIPGKRGGSAPKGGGSGEFQPYKGVKFSDKQPFDAKVGDKVIAYMDPENQNFHEGGYSNNRDIGGNKDLIKIGERGVISHVYPGDIMNDREVVINWGKNRYSSVKFPDTDYNFSKPGGPIKPVKDYVKADINKRLSSRFRIIK